MGAWGEAVFECDSAEEWAEQLISQGKSAMVLKPLTSVLKMRAGGVLEADLCASALAAAEVIAAALGHPCRGLPDEIAHLRALSNLKGLTIKRSQITDAGLEHLVALKSLKALTVEKSAVTPAGLNKLARQLGCKVFSDVLK